MNHIIAPCCNKKLLRRVGLLLALVASILPSCGAHKKVEEAAAGQAGGSDKKLTRTKAAELIRKSKTLLQDKAEIEIVTGELQRRKDAPIRPEYTAFSNLGYLTIKSVPVRSAFLGDFFVDNVSLTPEGSSASKEWSRSEVYNGHDIYGSAQHLSYKTPGATMEFVEVTGVTGGGPESKQGDVAKVEYSWKWVLTPFGRELEKVGLPMGDLTKLNAASTTMQLYDDGWRLAQ